MAGLPLEQTGYQLIGVTELGEVGNLLVDLDAQAAKIRLQALLADWLRMENVVVLSGSGTSVSAGGPTMATLESKVLEVIEASSSLPPAVGPIIAARKAARAGPAAAAQPGFETWLSLVANAHVLANLTGAPFSGLSWGHSPAPSTEELQWLVDRLRAAIFIECALLLPSDLTHASVGLVAPHLAFLSKLVARDSNLGRAHLFTLNYDTLFEQALELLGIQYFDGFTGRANARFDPSVYGLDVYYPGEVAEGRVRRFDRFLHFYKLHGSIHWFEEGGEMRARHAALEPWKDARSKSASDKAELMEKEFIPLNRVMGILPTANKFVETLLMPYAHQFRAFQVRLGMPQTFLLVLGYGFGDDHVTRMIETALTNPSLILLVVEPDPKGGVVERIRRYKELGKRAFLLCPTPAAFAKAPYTTATFDDFAKQVMPDVQWLDDFLRLRRFEKQVAQFVASEEDPPKAP